MNITDFLLARIAEDEAAAARAGSFTPWSETFQDDNYGHLTIQPSRIERECEAKRRIVDHCLAWDDEPNAGNLGENILRALAAVHADHPDYRDEWKL